MSLFVRRVNSLPAPRCRTSQSCVHRPFRTRRIDANRNPRTRLTSVIGGTQSMLFEVISDCIDIGSSIVGSCWSSNGGDRLTMRRRWIEIYLKMRMRLSLASRTAHSLFLLQMTTLAVNWFGMSAYHCSVLSPYLSTSPVRSVCLVT